ncbi:hypothetical protein BTM25_06410 [Actinomadura rubteroloni]|uniref:Uncharacterized protein n=1 Tax=Actinomadura rubteroloni TaxID=1926885 RepID=A0A2P4UMH1_9ACTN|nr:hypothetical protein [Actinomadura rubteroloni]POM26247.1 hypothetical protein BTM25_06410 [Actinomadura rubteroloni]
MATELARRAEARHPGWVVVWGAYRRAYTAWAAWSSGPLLVEAATVAALSAAIRAAERAPILPAPAHASGRPDGLPAPGAVGVPAAGEVNVPVALRAAPPGEGPVPVDHPAATGTGPQSEPATTASRRGAHRPGHRRQRARARPWRRSRRFRPA